MDFDREEARELTGCETLIMKAIWETQKDCSFMELQEIMRSRFGKNYAPTTLRTFLVNLINKGFIRTYRVKKNSYIQPRKGVEEYKAAQLQKQVKFWYNGSASDLIGTMLQALELTREDRDKIREFLDNKDHELDV